MAANRKGIGLTTLKRACNSTTAIDHYKVGITIDVTVCWRHRGLLVY